MNKSFLFLSLLACLFLIGLMASCARADDGIFPPAPAAEPYIHFDGRGFLINGKRTFIASGGMEYARVPHQIWRDRLLRMKRAGLNCVEVYNFWDFHEPQKGQFNFSGDADLNAFLKTVKSLDMYAICRVGPYYCAEWDSGGFPIWLRFEPGMGVREDNPPFLAAVDRFWDKLMPIVAANQINHGGAVILVQLENEHLQGSGTELPNAYFRHLRDKALSLGLQVPYFFSGVHHGGDPAGDNPWSSAGRTNPWFTTEFWSVWYEQYGETNADVATYDRRTWNVIADGGNGYNYYMIHGGSNFGFTNDDEDAASYDYGAAIGQAGDLRPLYYRFKRAALFARSFASILEDSDNATADFKGAATDTTVHLRARKSQAGTLLFLTNTTGGAVKTKVKEADGTLFPVSNPLTVAPSQTLPIVCDYALMPGMTLERSTPLLGILPQGGITTLVAYGAPGDVSELRFRLAGPVTGVRPGMTLKGNQLTVQDPIGESIDWATFKVGSQTIRILTMPTSTSDHTWFVDKNIIVGPEYVGDAATVNGKLHVTMEHREGSESTAWLFGTDFEKPQPLWPVLVQDIMPQAPTLTPWQTHPGDAEASAAFPDGSWKASADPLPMGADGDIGAYAWYRTTITKPTAGTYTLRFADGGDWASVFVSGTHVGSGAIKKGIPLTLPAGSSALAILTAHYGRPKEFGYMGSLAVLDAKGLRGPVILDTGKTKGQAITTWRIKDDNHPDLGHPPTETTGAGWTDGTTGPDIFHGRRGFSWYRTTLPNIPGPHRRLRFENVDDNATVYLNGKQVAAHEGWGSAFDVPLDSAWREGGPNELAVLDENTDSGGGIQGAVTLRTVTVENEIPVQSWKMRGGVGAVPTNWKPLTAPASNNSPAWYRATFSATPPGATGPHPILRVTTTGLSQGFVWLNGHNLGRYPEKIPINGLYLPECWLLPGRNEIVIFDEEGYSPAQVRLTVEQAASRFVIPLTEK